MNSRNFSACISWFPAVILLTMLVVKAWVDFDPSWDSWYYHIPYAGRIWGIIPASRYEMEPYIEGYFLGFPLLGETVQGFLWYITGHMQATNLFGAFGLIIYIAYLYKRFDVAPGLSALALVAIPAVQAHASSSYLDLAANLAVSVFILHTWQLYHRQEAFRAKELLPYFITGLIAANCKYQLIPVVMVLVVAAGGRIFWLNRHTHIEGKKAVLWALALAVMAAMVFYVPVKNTLRYHNPHYPLTFENQNNQVVFMEMGVPLVVIDNRFFRNWLVSVAEWERPFGSWGVDQALFPKGSPGDRMGGYDAFYVLAQLLFMLALCWRQPRAVAVRNLQLFAFMTIVTVWMPRSYILRYYMYWMITLVSLNLIWMQQLAPRWLRGVMLSSSAAALLAAAVMTRGFYIVPQFITMDELPAHIQHANPFPFVSPNLDLSLVSHVLQNGTVCIQGKQPMSYLYNSTFHPPFDYKLIARHGGETCPK